MRQQQQRENIRLKLVLSDEDDNVFGSGNIKQPSEITSCPSSCASLRMCYMNEAAFDDDDDDDVDCYREALVAGPLGSPDLIAGMRTAAQQECVSCENSLSDQNTSVINATRLSTDLRQKELHQETWVCFYDNGLSECVGLTFHSTHNGSFWR